MSAFSSIIRKKVPKILIFVIFMGENAWELKKTRNQSKRGERRGWKWKKMAQK
jgi:hypothetical protein